MIGETLDFWAGYLLGLLIGIASQRMKRHYDHR